MLSTETENYRYSLNVQCVVSSSYFSRVSFLLSRSCYSDTFGLMFWQSFNTRKVDVYIFTPQKVMGSRMLRIEELSRVKTFYLGEISREIFPPRSDFWSPLFFSPERTRVWASCCPFHCHLLCFQLLCLSALD